MSQVIRGPLTVLGRVLLATIFFMAAVGTRFPISEKWRRRWIPWAFPNRDCFWSVPSSS